MSTETSKTRSDLSKIVGGAVLLLFKTDVLKPGDPEGQGRPGGEGSSQELTYFNLTC